MRNKLSTQKTLKTASDLSEQRLIADEDIPILTEVIENFSMAIPAHLANLIDKNNLTTDPIAKQFIPTVDELTISANELVDPIGDNSFTKVKGIIHRYPDRCLFAPVQVCPVYCRFCFRRETVGTEHATLNPQELEAAYDYIAANTKLWEVILTGGDPLILKPKVLKNIFTRLNAIPHVEVIRIHTRVPMITPERITPEMIAALSSKKAVYIIIHTNHPNEFTEQAITACSELIDAGIPLLSQTTLLKGVNDTIEVLSNLMRLLIKNRIKPYYLHQGDLARGTAHFRTTLEQGQLLIKQLRGRFSGLCQPTYVVDIPGGFGKVPLGPHYWQKVGENLYQLEDYQGNFHSYELSE